MKKYGRCYGCKKILPAEVLEQVMFFKYHLHYGSFHHKLLCYTCEKLADEAGEETIKDKPKN